jgi:hypothetical protein
LSSMAGTCALDRAPARTNALARLGDAREGCARASNSRGQHASYLQVSLPVPSATAAAAPHAHRLSENCRHR